MCLQKNVQQDIHEFFIKQSIRNRCEILSSQGLQKLVVPIKHHSQKIPMNEVQIDTDSNWQNMHWKSIQTAYQNAPYFEHYQLEIKSFIYSTETDLFLKNKAIILWFIDHWELPITIQETSHFQKYEADDFRLKDWFDKGLQLNTYQQVFTYDKSFVPNLSILDLLLNEGPLGRQWIID